MYELLRLIRNIAEEELRSNILIHTCIYAVTEQTQTLPIESVHLNQSKLHISLVSSREKSRILTTTDTYELFITVIALILRSICLIIDAARFLVLLSLYPIDMNVFHLL